TLWPLAAVEFGVDAGAVSNRTREAIEREKALVLRSIKELEFDRAMGKVADEDFREMAARLKARAIGFMRQLDSDASEYRDLIERELQARLASPEAARSPSPSSAEVARDTRACDACETINDADAKFCKECGEIL
ncbi:MAG: zinc ribbon domain-containing protein, partial [Vicinamibacterales bacterium]|nr:zinc ribbon domain-containing protein [Vicinamibacterales bacterium]